MNRFLRKTFLFMLFAIVFYITALSIYGSLNLPNILKPNLKYPIGSTGHFFTRLREVKQVKDVDILFLGSSHTYRGFDTRVFERYGYKTFNLGSSSQTPIQTLLLLKRYLDDLNPKLVIYEVYPVTFTLDGVESALDLIANDETDTLILKMAADINHLKVYNTLCYGAIREIFRPKASFAEPTVKNGDTYIPGGFVERELSYYKPSDLPDIKFIMNEDLMPSFGEIVNMLDKRGIPLILVYAPIPSSNYSRYTNNSEFDSIMSGYAAYYNFNKILSLNDSLDFYDDHHLNQAGVEKFNERLITIIQKYPGAGIQQ